MALSANTTWEVRFDGSDTNGGGFVTGATGTDWTLQAAAQYSVTDAVTNGTTTITSASANFGTDVVGNILYIQGGTAPITAGWYEITARTNSTTITVDRSTGLTTGTGATLRIGGALASPGRAAANKVAGNDIYIKYSASAYTISSSSSNVSNGVINDTTAGTGQTNTSNWVGYDTTRTLINTDTNRPILQATHSDSTISHFILGANHLSARNLILDCNSKTASTGFVLSTNQSRLFRCEVRNATAIGISVTATTSMYVISCGATGCSGTAAISDSGAASVLYGCEAWSNTCVGFSLGVHTTAIRCIASGNTGSSSIHGFAASASGIRAIHCTAYGNGGAGFNLVSNVGIGSVVVNCIAEANGSVGFNTDGVKEGLVLLNCAGYNNNSTTSLSGQYSTTNIPFAYGFINGTAGSFFNNAGSGDFSLNNFQNRGNLLRGTGWTTTFPRGTSAIYADVGATQHKDVSNIIVHNGMNGGI